VTIGIFSQYTVKKLSFLIIKNPFKKEMGNQILILLTGIPS